MKHNETFKKCVISLFMWAVIFSLLAACAWTDASVIANVTFETTGPAPVDAGDGYLLPIGGDMYEATVGPIAGSTGGWSLTLSARDMNGNVAQAGPWTFQVVCIQ